METRDARSLPAVAQEDLRKKAVKAVLTGMTQERAAQIFGVSRYSIIKWIAAYRKGGVKALNARRRGRKKGQGCKLLPWQAAQIAKLVAERCPDQLKLPFVLWTREAVQEAEIRT